MDTTPKDYHAPRLRVSVSKEIVGDVWDLLIRVHFGGCTLKFRITDPRDSDRDWEQLIAGTGSVEGIAVSGHYYILRSVAAPLYGHRSALIGNMRGDPGRPPSTAGTDASFKIPRDVLAPLIAEALGASRIKGAKC